MRRTTYRTRLRIPTATEPRIPTAIELQTLIIPTNSQNCRNTKEENCVTDCHRDKDTSGKDSEDEWKNASNSRNAAKSYQARNAADNCKRQ